MKPHIARMVEEEKELSSRLEKLEVFINENPLFQTLTYRQQFLMGRQADAMRLYSHILCERLSIENAFQNEVI